MSIKHWVEVAVAVVVEEEVAAAVVEIGEGVEEETKKDWDIHSSFVLPVPEYDFPWK